LKLFQKVVLVLILGHLVIVQSMTYFAFSFLCYLSILVYHRKINFIRIALLIIPLVVFYSFVTDLTETDGQRVGSFDRVKNLSEGTDYSAMERQWALENAIQTFLDHFWIGVGPGNNRVFNEFTAAHNWIFEQASELGIFGGLGVVALVLGLGLYLFSLLFKERTLSNQLDFALLQPVALLLLSGCTSGIALTSTSANTPICLVAVWLALANRTVTEDELS
jgi:O-antigen ligase